MGRREFRAMNVKRRRSFRPLPQFGSAKWHSTRVRALKNPSTEVEEGDTARTQTTLWENPAADAFIGAAFLAGRKVSCTAEEGVYSDQRY
jgi:hypothetical protein